MNERRDLDTQPDPVIDALLNKLIAQMLDALTVDPAHPSSANGA